MDLRQQLGGTPVQRRHPTTGSFVRFALAAALVKLAVKVMPDRYHDEVDRELLKAVALRKGLDVQPTEPDDPNR